MTDDHRYSANSRLFEDEGKQSPAFGKLTKTSPDR